MRRVLELALLEGHRGDHLAAALVGGQRVEALALAVEHADAGRPVNLVAGEGVEVGVQVLDIDRHVRRRLGAVDQHRNPARVRACDDLLDGHDGAERVGDVGHGDQARARADERLEIVEQEVAGVVDRGDAQHDADAVAQQLPGHDVGVVLEGRDDHLVAGLHEGAAEAVGDQIERLGGVAGEHDLVGAAGVDEARDLFASALEGVGGELAHPVHPPVHVGIVGFVSVPHGVEHLARLLGTGRGIQIDQRVAEDLLRQDREVGPDALDIVGQRGVVAFRPVA